jgi:hypothetical protein
MVRVYQTTGDLAWHAESVSFGGRAGHERQLEPMPKIDQQRLAEQLVEQAGAEGSTWSGRTGCSPEHGPVHCRPARAHI